MSVVGDGFGSSGGACSPVSMGYGNPDDQFQYPQMAVCKEVIKKVEL